MNIQLGNARESRKYSGAICCNTWEVNGRRFQAAVQASVEVT